MNAFSVVRNRSMYHSNKETDNHGLKIIEPKVLGRHNLVLLPMVTDLGQGDNTKISERHYRQKPCGTEHGKMPEAGMTRLIDPGWDGCCDSC